MDDLTLRYYEAEMRYLREAGKEFARAHPDRAAMLNLDKPGARDPYVERLFEGFAFLMGRLREKLDDDLPELTEGLVSLLYCTICRLSRRLPSSSSRLTGIVCVRPKCWRKAFPFCHVLSGRIKPPVSTGRPAMCRYNRCTLRTPACTRKPMAALLSACASNALKSGLA